MKVKIGVEVSDSKGEILGTVHRYLKNLSTGEIRKFMIHTKGSENDIFFTPEDIAEATESKVTLRVSLEELRNR